MQPTPAKLVVVGIPAHSLFANSTRKFAFYCNLPSMFTTDHHFCLLNIYSRSFWLQYSFSSRQYIDCTTLTNHSSTTSFLKANHANSIGTQSKAFFKSANPKYKLQIRFCFFFYYYFSCHCPKINMVFVFPNLGLKPYYISVMSTCCLTNYLIILSAMFRIWSVNFSPL